MLGQEHLFGGVAVFVKVLGEAAFAAGEGDEVDLLAGLGLVCPSSLTLGLPVSLTRSLMRGPVDLLPENVSRRAGRGRRSCARLGSFVQAEPSPNGALDGRQLIRRQSGGLSHQFGVGYGDQALSVEGAWAQEPDLDAHFEAGTADARGMGRQRYQSAVVVMRRNTQHQAYRAANRGLRQRPLQRNRRTALRSGKSCDSALVSCSLRRCSLRWIRHGFPPFEILSERLLQGRHLRDTQRLQLGV